jgi:hypothetical protein
MSYSSDLGFGVEGLGLSWKYRKVGKKVKNCTLERSRLRARLVITGKYLKVCVKVKPHVVARVRSQQHVESRLCHILDRHDATMADACEAVAKVDNRLAARKRHAILDYAFPLPKGPDRLQAHFEAFLVSLVCYNRHDSHLVEGLGFRVWGLGV